MFQTPDTFDERDMTYCVTLASILAAFMPATPVHHNEPLLSLVRRSMCFWASHQKTQGVVRRCNRDSCRLMGKLFELSSVPDENASYFSADGLNMLEYQHY